MRCSIACIKQEEVTTRMSDRRKDGTGTLHVLPDSIIALIISYFPYNEIILLSSVSATFYVFCNDEGVWQDIYLEDTNSTFTFDGSWKHATLLKHKKIDKELTLPKTWHFEGSLPTHYQHQRSQTLILLHYSIAPHTILGIHSMYLYTRWYRAHADVSTFGVDKGDVERKSASEFAIDDFINNYDALSRCALPSLCPLFPPPFSFLLLSPFFSFFSTK